MTRRQFYAEVTERCWNQMKTGVRGSKKLAVLNNAVVSHVLKTAMDLIVEEAERFPSRRADTVLNDLMKKAKRVE